jgi:hypothetical protein
VTTHHERIKSRRRMQRRIQLVVEERRMALGLPGARAAVAADPDETVELPQQAAAVIAGSPAAIGRVAVTPR